MRCGRAQKLMTAALDRELPQGRRLALENHVAGCAACAHEIAATRSLLAAVDRLPMEQEVPFRVETATLRRVRALAAGEHDTHAARWWRWLPLPALAAVGVAVLAFGIGTRGPTALPSSPAARSASQPAMARVSEPARLEQATAAAEAPSPPKEPPPALAAAPELFMNLPVIRNMEKLEHFESITMIPLPSNG